jgi:hypothetical protein
MKTRDVIAQARGLFVEEPRILRVDACVRRETGGDLSIDFTFIVDGDLYEGESRVISLVAEFMTRYPTLPVEFMVLPSSVQIENHGVLVLSREKQRDSVESPRPSR